MMGAIVGILVGVALLVCGMWAAELVSERRRQRFEMRRKYLEARLDRDLAFLEELLDEPGEGSP